MEMVIIKLAKYQIPNVDGLVGFVLLPTKVHCEGPYGI